MDTKKPDRNWPGLWVSGCGGVVPYAACADMVTVVLVSSFVDSAVFHPCEPMRAWRSS